MIEKNPSYTHKQELYNSITHFIGVLFAIAVFILFLVYQIRHGISFIKMYPFYIYVFTMFVVFLVSTVYHSRPLDSKTRWICRVIDHSDIYLFVAGTYTPICLLAISNSNISTGVLFAEYSLAIAGILVTVFGGLKYKTMEIIAYIIYLVDGWMLMFVYPFNQCLEFNVFIFVLIGGIIYTAGAILYGIGKKKIWFHTLFHVFIVVAAVIQFIGIWNIVSSL